jgi:hypothetical protein
MNYVEELRLSVMVKNPINIDNIENRYGKYWANISYFILGLHDVRARMGTFTNPWNATSNPIFAAPKLVHVSDSLSDLMNKRACELLAISSKENRPIAILWSGGIDSTGVVSSFIKNCTNPEQIHIYCSQKSILENPMFYKNHIVGKFKCHHIRTMDVNEQFIDANILIHGDPGDCLFGPSMPMYSHLIPSGAHQQSWKDHRNDLIQGIEYTKANPGFAEWYVNKVSDNIEEVNLYNIHTVTDWWWWHYFNLKWEFSMMRPFFETRRNLRSTISKKHIQSYADTSFFNTAEFQSWSYSNLHRLCIDQKQHKADLKQYIYELDKNEFYKSNKAKTMSLSGIVGNRPLLMDKDFYSYMPQDTEMVETMRSLLEDYKG